MSLEGLGGLLTPPNYGAEHIELITVTCFVSSFGGTVVPQLTTFLHYLKLVIMMWTVTS